MKERMRRQAAIVLFVLAMLGAMLACGTASSMCYSQYPGCEETATVLEWAAGRE